MAQLPDPDPQRTYKRQWRKHPAAMRDWEDLPDNGKQGLLELMGRHRRGEPILRREIDNYGGGLRALKYSEAHNEFRCYFAELGFNGHVLLAVGFDYKKTERAQTDVPKQRLKDWKAEAERRRNLARKGKDPKK